MEDLKTCPFCGSEPKVLPSNPDLDGDDWTRIICSNYSCEVKVSVEKYGEGHRNIAVTKWNKRFNKDEKKTYPQIKEILDYLNDAKRKMPGNEALRGYRETPAAKAMINARLKEKFTTDDFKLVIDFKCETWKDSKMSEYVRPSTLFKASKFSEYLCEAESNINKPIRKSGEPEKPQTAEEIYNRMADEARK